MQQNFCDLTTNVAAKLTAKIKAGGCAAKISPNQLSEIVRGLPEFANPRMLTAIDTFEDAAVYKISDELALVQTIDFFPPVVDDPFLFGQIAAANALSDIYAMGATPTLALSVLCFPVCDFPLSVAHQIVAGGAQTLMQAGAVLAGGHSIQGPEALYGLSVTGFIHPDQILTNGGGQDGDLLVLTKPIGTGALLLAHKGEVLGEDSLSNLIGNLTLLNREALTVAKTFPLHAATDITGFGLIGHIHEIGKASKLKAVIWGNSVPLLPEALTLVSQGFVPAGAYANRKAYESITHIKEDVQEPLVDLFFDPQTSGGLLFSVNAADANALVAQLRAVGLSAAIIGNLQRGTAGHVEVCHDG